MQHHKTRQSFVIPFMKIVVLEIGLVSLHLLFQKISFAFGWHAIFMDIPSTDMIEIFLFHLVNIIVLLLILIDWFTAEHAISPKEIITITGIFKKEKFSYDIRGMQELEILQSIFGRILHYGTIRLKSPMWKSDVFLKNVPCPEIYAEVIERYRAEAVAENPLMNIVPKQN